MLALPKCLSAKEHQLKRFKSIRCCLLLLITKLLFCHCAPRPNSPSIEELQGIVGNDPQKLATFVHRIIRNSASGEGLK